MFYSSNLSILQTKAPFAFDTKLPPITSDDISFLRNRVPELAEKLRFVAQAVRIDVKFHN